MRPESSCPSPIFHELSDIRAPRVRIDVAHAYLELHATSVNYYHLRYFLSVVRAGSVAAASAGLRLAPPTVAPIL